MSTDNNIPPLPSAVSSSFENNDHDDDDQYVNLAELLEQPGLEYELPPAANNDNGDIAAEFDMGEISLPIMQGGRGQGRGPNVASSHNEVRRRRRLNNNIPPPPQPPPQNNAQSTRRTSTPRTRRTSTRTPAAIGNNNDINNDNAPPNPSKRTRLQLPIGSRTKNVQVTLRLQGEDMDNPSISDVPIPFSTLRKIRTAPEEEEEGSIEAAAAAVGNNNNAPPEEEEEEGSIEAAAAAVGRRRGRRVGRLNAETTQQVLPALDDANVPPAPAQNIVPPMAAEIIGAIVGGNAGAALGNGQGAIIAEECGFGIGSYIANLPEILSGDVKLSHIKIYIRGVTVRPVTGLKKAYDEAKKHGMAIDYGSLYRSLPEGPAAMELADRAGFVDGNGESLNVMLFQNAQDSYLNESASWFYIWDRTGTCHRSAESAACELGVFIGSIRLPTIVDMLQNAHGLGLPPGTLAKPSGPGKTVYYLPPDAEEVIQYGSIRSVVVTAGVVMDRNALNDIFKSFKQTLKRATGLEVTELLPRICDVINGWTDRENNLSSAGLTSHQSVRKWGPKRTTCVTHFIRCHDVTFPLLVEEFSHEISVDNEALLTELERALPNDLGSRTEYRYGPEDWNDYQVPDPIELTAVVGNAPVSMQYV